MFLAVLALAGCGATPMVVQSGSPSAPAPAALPVTDTSAAALPSDTMRALAKLDRGWNRIEGREGTGCAQDSTFAFRVRPGLTDRVFVFLNGGGMCWRGQDCDPASRGTYTTNADSANDASPRVGLFDVTRDDNPVRDYTMIFMSACTGDAHIGARTVEYEVPNPKAPDAPRTFAVRHEGAANTEAVLAWLFTNVRTPRVVFVAGSGTGAVASAVVATKIAYHYPRARVVQLGDGAGAYASPAVPQALAHWGATDYLSRDLAYRSLDSADFTFARLYRASLRASPRARFAQLNTVADPAQATVLAQLGVRNTPLARVLGTQLDSIRQGAGWFRSYTAPGRTGALLRSNALYATTVGGVALKDWILALVDGEPVENVGLSLLASVPQAPASKPPVKPAPKTVKKPAR